jgi:lactobin A/cerein 7B family class IIb bacteriocin
MQTTIENSDIRALTDAELADVNGGIWGIVARVGFGLASAGFRYANHNGSSTISVGELCEQNGINL